VSRRRDSSLWHVHALGSDARVIEDGDRTRAEWPAAAALFAFAIAVFLAQAAGRASALRVIASGVLFGGLAGVTLALSVTDVRERLRRARMPVLLNVLAAPVAITTAIALYSAVAGLPVVPRAAAFGVYLALPALIVWTRRGVSPKPLRVLVAAVALWLPIEFALLPTLRLPDPGGLRATPLVGLTNGLYLFLVACPVARVGYTFSLRSSDVRPALLATVLFAIVGIPIGLATGFLHWNPRLEWATVLVAPVAIYLATAVPEEFLFRGLIQNALEQWAGRAGLPIAAVIFGVAHLPDRRYVLLAAIAGVAYGWVYMRTRRVTAAAVTHALVDWIWMLLLRG
jgi:membrane protease YdiL (CAAX protease family)